MAYKYYINRNQQPNGDYEVHKSNCNNGANIENQIDLGYFNSCQEAVEKAKKKYPEVAQYINGCYYCSYGCHTS